MEFFFGFNEEGAVVNFDDLADDGAGIFRRAEGLHMVVAAVDKVVGCSAVESVLERGLKVKFDFPSLSASKSGCFSSQASSSRR